MQEQQERTPLSDRLLLKVPEAVAVTGYSRPFIYRLIEEGRLPSVRVGRSVRVRREDLERFIEEHMVGGDA